MKFVSLSLKILAGIIALVAITVGVIIAVVDPNDYKDEITQVVKQETGRDLQIENMSLSIFPSIGLNLEKTSLSNAKGFSEQPFLEVDRVQIGAAILPLLSQKLEVDALTLHGLSLNLEKNAQGVTNWDDLTQQAPTKDAQTSETESPSQAETSEDSEKAANPMEKLAALNFGGLDIQNGKIHWQDAQAQQTVQLTLKEFTTGAITFGEFFQITLSAETQVSEPELTAAVQMSIEAKLEQSGAYALRNLSLNTQTFGQGIPVEKASTQLNIPTLDLALEDNKINLPNLMLDLDVIGGPDFPMQTIKGQLNLTALTGDLTQNAFSADSLTLNTALTGETLPGGKAKIDLSLQPSINLTEQVADIKALSLKAIDLEATGSVHATQITGEPKVDASFKIAETNLRQLLTQLGITLPEMADPTTLTKFAAAMGVKFNSQAQSLTVKDLAITLDQTKLTGNAGLSEFDKPNIRYDLALTSMDLNRYLPPKKEQAETQPETAPSGDEDPEIVLPTELLRSLVIDGRFKAQSIIFDKLNPKNIVLTVKGAKGKIKANPIKADIFNTVTRSQAGLDVSGKTPKYSFQTDIKNVPIGEVLLALTDSDTITGKGSVVANVRTAGSRVSHFKKNLNGTASVNLANGAVKGFNIAQSIREAKAKITGETLPKSNQPLQTDFSSLIGQFKIKQGVVDTQKLIAKAPFMRINGLGKINLPKESLDYLVKAKITSSDKGQGGEELKELNGLTIPVKLKGAWVDPDISLDLDSILEQKAQAEIEKKKEQVVEEAKKKAGQQLENVFKGFKF